MYMLLQDTNDAVYGDPQSASIQKLRGNCKRCIRAILAVCVQMLVQFAMLPTNDVHPMRSMCMCDA